MSTIYDPIHFIRVMKPLSFALFLILVSALYPKPVQAQNTVGPYTFKVWVTGRSHLHFQGNKIWIDHRNGSFMKPEKFHPVTVNGEEWKAPPTAVENVSEPFILPQRYPIPINGQTPLSAKVSYTEDRGRAHVIQQPRKENDYTTIVEVLDPPNDSGFLSLKVIWDPHKQEEPDPGFLYLDEKKYKLVICGGYRVGGIPWEKCRKLAQEMGGDLAKINSKEKRIFLHNAMKSRLLRGPVAIGGKRNPDNTYSWFSGDNATIPKSIDREGIEYPYLGFRSHGLLPIGPEEICHGFLIEYGKTKRPINVQPKITKSAPVISPATPKRMINSTLQTNTSKLLSLLVVSLGDSRYAGLSSKLSISALPIGETESTLKFNQDVGEDMDSALTEVIRFLKIRHNGWPEKYGIELAFAEKYSPKDGPSAAVATALLMESLITGTKLDENFAVTGDMNAAGDVQPIGGVAAKLRGAKKGGATIVAIPEKNRIRALDLLLTDGVGPLLATQIFTIKTFEEAFELASAERSENLTLALKLFGEIQQAPQTLTSQVGMKKLANIVRMAPNHLSARLLLAKSGRKLPRTLSIVGSLEEIDKVLGSLPAAAKADLNSSNRPHLTEIGAARSKLLRLRSQIDPRAKHYLDSWIEWTSIADSFLSGRMTYSLAEGKLKMAFKKTEAGKKKLLQDVSVQEELLQ